MDVTSIASGSTAYYVAENAPIPASEMTLAQQVLLRPRELAALIPVSNRLLRDASENPDIEQVLREDMAEVLALRADLAFLRGSGSGNEPLGIRNWTGLTPAPDLGANGGTPSFDALKDMVAALRAVNAPFSSPGWVFHPRTINTLEKIKTTTNEYLADAGLLTFDASGGGGTLLGFPFVTTTQIPINATKGTSTDASEIYFSSDWREAWIGEEQALEIEASGEAAYDSGGGVIVSAWSNRQTVFRAVTTHDLGLRRPALFSVMLGVRP
jgi:HK97 family phage major capsid protein